MYAAIYERLELEASALEGDWEPVCRELERLGATSSPGDFD